MNGVAMNIPVKSFGKSKYVFLLSIYIYTYTLYILF